MLQSTFERVPSLETKTQNINTLSERIDFLKKSRAQFMTDRDKSLLELFALQHKINSYDYSISEIDEELHLIKDNYRIIIRDKDPLTKARLIFRRHRVKCPICNKLLFSKKDLKVHKFKVHGY